MTSTPAQHEQQPTHETLPCTKPKQWCCPTETVVHCGLFGTVLAILVLGQQQISSRRPKKVDLVA